MQREPARFHLVAPGSRNLFFVVIHLKQGIGRIKQGLPLGEPDGKLAQLLGCQLLHDGFDFGNGGHGGTIRLMPTLASRRSAVTIPPCARPQATQPDAFHGGDGGFLRATEGTELRRGESENTGNIHYGDPVRYALSAFF